MDRPEPRNNRALLVRALHARIADPDRGALPPPPHDSDFDTLDVIARRASARLAEAIGIVARTEGCGYARHRSALAHVERLEYGAHMPLVVRALCDTPHEHDTLIGWLDTLRRLYEAFWRAVAAAPSAVPLRGTALGDPPTPRSVDRWLRAHLGSGPVAPAQTDQMDTPLEHPREWAAAAGNAIESLWRYAAQGIRRVPDVWPARRALLWQHGACAPETLFVLAVAQDVVTHRIVNDAKDDGDDRVREDIGHAAAAAYVITRDHVNGMRDGMTIVDARVSADVDGSNDATRDAGTGAHNSDYDADDDADIVDDDDDDDDNNNNGNYGDDGNDDDARHRPHAEETVFTRTAVLYAALRATPTSQEGHALRVVCHASYVAGVASESEPTLTVFTSADADALLASLSLPPAVPWTAVAAVQRWLAFLADGGSLNGIARSLLAPRPEPAPDLAAHRAKAAGDAVRASLDDAKHEPLGPFARTRQHQRQRPYGACIRASFLFLFFSIIFSFVSILSLRAPHCCCRCVRARVCVPPPFLFASLFVRLVLSLSFLCPFFPKKRL
ncbi:hypothetical protein pmac_cds_374 [Pandoravirus macleodensis]|uniref:Uncharacterized protein n=1 Tax=Pandoravirus macleodensis TaxID=2107707 RepID=A0A2U7UF85_9VIRU|nr:hypothetical protein pmac_cds_374 [Pandoravirus macleodensis]AVK77062.1 hypothetical protein pmac_cds_374 [Pandoravirus macleodensis]